MLLSGTVDAVTSGGAGAIWTTLNDCGGSAQDVNHYSIGDNVYINGKDFSGSTTYAWAITGQGGGASCDPDAQVASGNAQTYANGTFCFNAYRVQTGDCGEYSVNFGDKNDNYRINQPTCVDLDSDGYYAGPTAECPDGTDCNDQNRTVNPGAPERCNGFDDNCDGQVDEDLTFDDDGDGYTSIGSCQGTRDDCDDQDPDAHPGAPEICNGLDDDCDGQVDEGLTFDADGDGYTSLESCEGGRDDCDDGNAAVHPGAAELCNGLDDDCDGGEDEDGDSLCDGLDRYDDWTHYCDADAHARHMLFHDFSCYGSGGCVEDAYYTNESIVEDCGGKGGVMNDCGLLGWSCSEEFNGVHCLISDIQPDDGRCQTVCSADTLRHGVCLEGTYRCGFEDEDCSQYDNAYCEGTTLHSVDYTCGNGACVVEATTPVDCDNGLWCDGAETCSGGECLEGSPTDCSDGVSCTEDSCDEASDSCLHAADDGLCDAPGDCRDAVCDISKGCELTIDAGYVFEPPTCGLGECVSHYYCDIEDGDACVPLTPEAESCDGLDNDCDGQADEDYPNLGEACTAGVGACMGEGVYVCAGNGTACDATAGIPTTESCGNGVDDDCDGKTDCQDQDCTGAEECFYERPCGDGLDLCEWSETLPLGSEDKSSCDLMYNTVWPSPSDRTVTCLFDGTENSNHTFYFTVDNDVVSCRLNGNEIVSNVVHENCAPQDPRDAYAYAVDASAGENTLSCLIRDRGVQSFFDACVVGAGVRCPDLDGDGFKDAACGGNDCDDGNDAAYPGAAESCNGADDDCDGSIDETFTNKGESCTTGQGVCQASGTYVCAQDGLNTVCDAVEGAPTGADDDCNGLDEDCSGTADDNYAPTGTSCGAGACAAVGELICVAGQTQDTCQAGTPAAEACNGVDDDCDGSVDETFTDLGQSCTAGQGVCIASGAYVCVANGLGTECNAVAGTPGIEVCDGGQLDEDCDGLNNEGCQCIDGATQSCYGGPEGTSGVGACMSGTETCAGGVWGTCTGQATPITETCNGVDDDCNGLIDDGLTAPPADMQQGVCAGSAKVCSGTGGWTEPAYTLIPTYQGTETLCDGLDNDCDGQADEAFTNKGESCTVGVGVCEATGTYVCSQDGLTTECSATPGSPTGADDDCNGVDEDCSGTADENYVPTVSSCGTGVCASLGLNTCVSGSVQDTCAEGAPTGADDDCNGVDENCNGAADENYQPMPTSCGAGVCAAAGQLICTGGQTQDTCLPTQPTGLDNDCNGVDEDCDGTADNNYVPAGTTCGTGICESSGQLTCAFGQTWDSCVPDSPLNETCNGLDDDCDGTTDEGCECIDGATQPCYTGCSCTEGIGACHGGTQTCANGLWGECAGEVTPTIEVCNGVDDDCDGHTDEFLGSTTCGQGACFHTVENCVFGQAQTCDPLQGASVELCDGVDNDCDGLIDEDYIGLGQACTAGYGVCQAGGTTVCAANGLGTACNAVLGNATGDDTDCNGVDDDCDGVADDGYAANQTSCGIGACGRTGLLMCVGGQTQDTCQAGMPSNESCNGLDDDCDGQSDEDYNVGASCSVGVGQCASAGYMACMEGGAACDAVAGTPSNETCDGFDNDCDGTVDEGCECIDGATQSCYDGAADTMGVGICRGGTQACANGLWGECAGDVLPAQESCNGLDDDCDGLVDEGIACGKGGGGGGGGPGYQVTNREYRIDTEDRFPVPTTLPAPTTTQPPATTTTLMETGSERNPVESAGLVCPPTGGTAALLSETQVCEPAAEAPRVTGFAIWPGEIMGLTGAWYARNFLILLILAAGYYVYAKDSERLMKANKAGGQAAQ